LQLDRRIVRRSLACKRNIGFLNRILELSNNLSLAYEIAPVHVDLADNSKSGARELYNS
jgi:hypothetical protein